MLMRRERAQLLVVDLQERLLPAVPRGEEALARAILMVRAAGRLGVPITVSEHCADKIGPSVEPLREVLPDDAVVLPKTAFAATVDPAIAERLRSGRAAGRDQIVVCGTEAHVCVLQSVLALLDENYRVFVAADAVASRADANLHAATARLLHAGAHWVTSEMVVFEWLARADDEAFKDLLALVK